VWEVITSPNVAKSASFWPKIPLPARALTSFRKENGGLLTRFHAVIATNGRITRHWMIYS